MLAIRLAKIACAGTLALYAGLVAFGNLTDYWTNFAFVEHVLDMDQLPVGSALRWRAISSVTLHHGAYLLIIGAEIASAGLAAAGAVAMARQLRSSAQSFQAAKGFAILGLALGFLLYEGGFVAVGGEWFGMWQARDIDAVQSAFRVLMTMLGVLIFVTLKDED